MNGVESVNSVFSDLSINKKQQNGDEEQELGQSAFLKLMITQMENQSPLDPQDNTQFISQLAQFSSVESLDKLNKNFDSFSNWFFVGTALQLNSMAN